MQPNLRLLPAGLKPPNPAEVLGSPLTDELFRQLSSLSDIVIIDTPPVLAVADPVILAKKADGVVVVASIGATERHNLERAKATLDTSHARLLGLVVNRVQRNPSYYSGYYGSGEDHDRTRTRSRVLGLFRRKNDGDTAEEPAA